MSKQTDSPERVHKVCVASLTVVNCCSFLLAVVSLLLAFWKAFINNVFSICLGVGIHLGISPPMLFLSQFWLT